MIVCNSTVLIYLSKIDKLWILKELFKTASIPEGVKREVVDQGKIKNCVDALEIEKSINPGWIKVEDITVDLILEDIGIDKGEAEAISLAHKKKVLILLDQTHARNAAKLLGLKPRGTIYVLLLALKKRLLDYDSYLLCLLDLVEMGFRMDQEVYLEALRLGKKCIYSKEHK